jgi:glycosyltransferase involved in cell wall biosynthesis
VIDLQCCQTAARSRGMGRYSLSLVEEIARQGKAHDFLFLLNRRYLPKSRAAIEAIERMGGHGAILYYSYPDVRRDVATRFLREKVANLLRNDRVETASADVYHVCSLFEGESVYGNCPSFVDLPNANVIVSATLYDFIPVLYPEKYLNEPALAEWYRRTMGVASRLDIGFAISDATRRDAERLLFLPPEKLVNVSGDVDARFAPGGVPADSPIWRAVRPDIPFVFYVGGPDFRKNMIRLVEAFAAALPTLGTVHQLVLLCNADGEEASIARERARRLGIAQRVLFLGEITDDSLKHLYQACALFIFPSLYEGLGLPVIEAMRCGAPVLVGDNSSLTELVPEDAYRFDALDVEAMTRAMTRVLNDSDLRSRMRDWSVARAAAFSWSKSAARVLESWEAAHDRKRAARPRPQPARAKIAMFSPLPPLRTGIADYCADFLPVLAKFADIEVFVDELPDPSLRRLGVPILHHAQFPARAGGYDAVVYQLGNSPYHHYMRPYLAHYPGVVVLHDAFMGHLSHDPANPGPFVLRMLARYHGAARALIRADDNGSQAAYRLIGDLSCAAGLVEQSLGVIVHSRFARDIVARGAVPAIAPPIEVHRQYRAPRPAVSADDAARARARLGLPGDALLIMSFGHVAATKGVLELIAAFRRSAAATSAKAQLIFVGELEGGAGRATPFAQAAVDALRGAENIRVTGFVDAAAYEDYLASADIGVQLRTITRGETSRALLDLFASGVATIYNRLGATAELPEAVGLRIDDCATDALAAAIDRLAGDPDLRRRYGAAAAAFVDAEASSDAIAEGFVAAVLEMKTRARVCGPAAVSRKIAELLKDAPVEEAFVDEICESFVDQERAELSPRLLIDVTHIREGDLKTGVQRVVREFTRAAYALEDCRVEAQAFAFTEEGLAYADDFAQACGARFGFEALDARYGRLDLRPFDRMLLADGTWHLTDWMQEPLGRLNEVGGAAYALVHDILPLERPDLFLPHVCESMTKWIALMAARGAGMIATSQAGADALIGALKRGGFEIREGLRIGYQRLGADFSAAPDEAPTSKTRELLSRRNLFVMVGTVEPRKGHDYVLDAFESLWARGVDATLVFVGKPGWNVDALIARFDGHPQKDRKFFCLGFMPEADVAAFYRGAHATIVASIAEGFGLPIYEAAFHGSPLLLSDLAVFRELAGDHARYFTAGSAEALAATALATIEGGARDSRGVSPSSWRDFTEGVRRFMDGVDTYHRF